MAKTGRARSTVVEYLTLFIELEQPASIDAWVDADLIETIRQAAIEVGGDDRLKPIYEKLGQQVPYDTIRLVLKQLTAAGET